MQKTTQSDRKVFTILFILCVIPALSGGARIFSMVANGDADPENLNYIANPIPIAVHMIAYLVFCLIGTFQVAPVFRRKHLKLHRIMGRMLVPIGIAAALTGIWMTLYYPPMITNGEAIGYVRITFGSGMILCIAFGVLAIRYRDVARHQRWMLRSLAIAFGASTQAFVAIPWLLFVGEPQGIPWAVAMTLAWVFNLAVAEGYANGQAEQSAVRS